MQMFDEIGDLVVYDIVGVVLGMLLFVVDGIEIFVFVGLFVLDCYIVFVQEFEIGVVVK